MNLSNSFYRTLLIVSVLFIASCDSCVEGPPTNCNLHFQDAVPISPTVVILEDNSGTTKDFARLQVEPVKIFLELHLELNREITLEVSNVTDRPYTPAVIKLVDMEVRPEPNQSDYAQLSQEVCLTQQENLQALNAFISPFIKVISPPPDTPESFSHIENKLTNIIRLMENATSEQPVTAVISSDFMEDRPEFNNKPRLVQSKFFLALEKALADNPNTSLYIIYNDLIDPDSDLFIDGAQYIGNYRQFFNIYSPTL